MKDVTILFVDDEANILKSLRRSLLKEPYGKRFAGSGREALEILEKEPVHVIVCDMKMPEMDGLTLLRKVKERHPEVVRMVLSGAATDVFQLVEAINTGEIFRYVLKPLEPSVFKETLRAAIDHYLIHRDRRELVERLERRNRELEVALEERKRAERVLAESEEKFRAMTTAASDAVILVNHRGEVTFWNKSAELMFGYPAEEILGANLHERLLPAGDTEFSPEKFEEFKRTGCGEVVGGRPRERRARKKDGSEFPVELSVSAVEIRGERHAVGIVRDISERKAAEEALRRARQAEIEVESRIEENLLKGSLPREIRGASLAAVSVPSRHLDGDFYDFIDFHPRCFDVMMGDVMGKGVHAALIGAGIKQYFLRTLSRCARGDDGRSPCSMEVLMSRVHAEVAPQLSKLETFATLCYTRFDLDARRMDFVDCGHPPIVHYKAAAGECAFLSGENLPMGILENEKHEVRSTSFRPGDAFLFYSDGITEAEAPEGGMFGLERLGEFVKGHGKLPPEALIGALRQEVGRFTGSPVFQDDFTCVAVAIAGDGP